MGCSGGFAMGVRLLSGSSPNVLASPPGRVSGTEPASLGPKLSGHWSRAVSGCAPLAPRQQLAEPPS